MVIIILFMFMIIHIFVKEDQYVPSYNGANTGITGNTRCKFNFNSITKTCDITGEGINQHYDFSNFSPMSSVYKFYYLLHGVIGVVPLYL